MSKKKNTLKDLDEFLKQQAATLVSPAKLSDKIESLPSKQKVTEEKEEIEEPAPAPTIPSPEPQSISAAKILSDLKLLASQEGNRFNENLYDLIIRSVEYRNQYSPEDKMLINTALYLKGGERWKEVIREYWRKRN
jgi:hypothetical protein